MTTSQERSLAAEPTRTWLQRGYLPVLRGALRRPIAAVLVAVAILVGTFALVPQLTTNFLGGSGSNTLTVVTLRGVIGAALMAPLVPMSRQGFGIDRRA